MYASTVKYFLLIVHVAIVLLNCGCSDERLERVEDRLGRFTGRQPNDSIFTGCLSPSEYLYWLRQHKGITFNETGNEKLSLRILYKPLAFEAAMSGNGFSGDEIQYIKNLKKEFHHILLECVEKKYSVAAPANNKMLLNHVKENFYSIGNGTDTVRNVIFEVFPAVLINQPHQFLVLLPDNDAWTTLEAGVKGAALGLKDLRIIVSRGDIRSFPEVKL